MESLPHVAKVRLQAVRLYQKLDIILALFIFVVSFINP